MIKSIAIYKIKCDKIFTGAGLLFNTDAPCAKFVIMLIIRIA